MQQYDNISFKARFRISKNVAHELVDMLGDHLEGDSTRFGYIPPVLKILITLYYYASSCFLRCIGDVIAYMSQPHQRLYQK